MTQWKKVKIGEFLTESKIIAEKSDAAHRITVRLNCRGVEQRTLKAEKRGATKYYTRKGGQFIYGKQNIHKGAFGIIPKKLDGFTSSADLPAFDIDLSKCLPEWICLCLQKDEYYKSLQKNVKGVGSQRLAVNVFLSSEIPLPSIQTQQEIVKKISLQLQKTEQFFEEIESQKKYAKLLRQNILQDAIEGKLTEDWRKTHPVIKGDPDYDAEALFEHISKERDNKKKLKKLSPITDDEKPFEIPIGWKWVRLGGICDFGRCQNIEPNYLNCDDWILDLEDIEKDTGRIINFRIFSDNNSESTKHIFHKGDLLYSKLRPYLNKVVLAPKDGYCTSEILPLDFGTLNNAKYMQIVLMSPYFVNYATNLSYGMKMPRLGTNDGKNARVSLPPLKEQEEIVNKVESLLAKVTELENQITEREQLVKQLMQSILQDAFEEK